MLEQVPLLAAFAHDVTFRGDATALAVAQAGAGACSPSIGDNYVAINSDQWNATQNCNTCIEVLCADDRCSDERNPLILYVTGECPGCEDEGLDMSPVMFKTLTGSDPALYTLAWEFTACPTGGKTYQAGKVEPADEKNTEVNILQTTQDGVGSVKDMTDTQQTTNMYSNNEARTSATSPFVVVLIVAGAVCALALVAVMYKAKRNRTRRDECVTKSFNTFSSPAQRKKRAAIVTI